MLVSQFLIQHHGDKAVYDFHIIKPKNFEPNDIKPKFQVGKPNHACESITYTTSW